MPTFQFEAMDAQGQEIKDVIEAQTEEEAQATIRQMGYFVTKISAKKAAAGAKTAAGKKKRPLALGGASTKQLTTFRGSFRFCRTPACPSSAACGSWKVNPSRAS